MSDRLIYFLRHGETDWNTELRFQGQRDIPINQRGRAQAMTNGRMLASLVADPSKFDFIASPLGRTRETMEIVRSVMGLEAGDYRVDDRLKEVNYGDWEGTTLREIAENTPELIEARKKDKWNYLPPGKTAESYSMLSGRVLDWIGEINTPTICVTHGGIIRALFHELGGFDQNQAADMRVYQDRVVCLSDDSLDWL